MTKTAPLGAVLVFGAIAAPLACRPRMQVEQRQTSIITSLTELREIEQQRIADERAAIRTAEAARVAAREAAERQVREAAEAAARAEREAALAIERARIDAEREARLRIDAAAAAELARQQVALASERQSEELALRRAEVARTRPTWMLAVTALAVAAAGVLVWFTLESRSAADDAQAAARAAEAEKAAAKQHAREAAVALVQIEQEQRANSAAIQAGLDAVKRADTKAQRDAADAELKRARARDLEIAERLRLAREREEREKRKARVVIPKECEGATFAAGCTGR